MRTFGTSTAKWILLTALTASCSSDESGGSPGATGGGGGLATGGQSSGGSSGTVNTGGATGGTTPMGTGGAATTGGASATDGGSSGGSNPGSGGGGPSDSGANQDAGDGSSAPPPALKVTVVDTYTSETQKVAHPVDLGGYDLSVLVYDSAGKKFSTNPPTVTGPGAFEVKTLPAGDRYVRYSKLGAAPLYFVTTSTTLDLGVGRFGRPDVATSSAGTKLVLDVTGMQGWQNGDLLELYSLGAGVVETDVASAQVGAPAALDTAISGLTDDFGAQGEHLVDGSKGDRGYLVHLSTRTLAGGGTYQAVSDVFSMPSFTMADAQQSTVSGAFTKPTAATLDVDWKGSQFAAELANCAPAGTLKSLFFDASSQPYPELGPSTGSPDAFFYQPTDTTDLAATFAYSDAFASKWPLSIDGRLAYKRTYALPSTLPAALTGNIDSRMLAPGPVTLKPLVGCVRNAKVAGNDALSDVTGTGTSPTIAFDAPAFGTPNGYEVLFYRLTDSGGTTTTQFAGHIVTPNTSVVVPPGIMAAGNAYAVVIRADVRGSLDMNEQPALFAFPGGVAELLSGIVRP